LRLDGAEASRIAKIAKANRIETMKESGGIWRNLFGGVEEKNMKKIVKISVAMPTPCDPTQGCC
jgi:hypothetical protein